MADPELEALRKQRLAQLENEYGGKGSNAPAEQNTQKKQQEDVKNSILSQILDQSARARLNTLMLGKPEKGRMIEAMLIRMAQSGQIGGQIGEKELIGLLESINKQTGSTQTTVKFDRRRAALDSDDDDL